MSYVSSTFKASDVHVCEFLFLYGDCDCSPHFQILLIAFIFFLLREFCMDLSFGCNAEKPIIIIEFPD